MWKSLPNAAVEKTVVSPPPSARRGGGGSSLRANSKASKWFGGMERVRHEIYEKTRITPRALY